VAISDDDLDACFSTDDFAVPATFTLTASPLTTLEVDGHFTNGSDATVLYGVDIEAVEPSFTCRTSEIESVRNKMAVEIEGNDYTVARIQKVGTGVSVVYLKTS
jgi:hypothetical protein